MYAHGLMSALLPLTLVMTLASPAGGLTYASPPRGAQPTLEQHKLTTFEADTRVFVASHDVNLRSAAGPEARVIAKLPFGAEVTVLERGARASVGSRVDHWYRVSVQLAKRGAPLQGHLFGSTLTPFLVRAGLDDDDGLEAVSASWSWRHAVSLRLFDDGAEAVRAEWRPGASWRGGRIEKLVAHAASATGVPLLELEVLIGDPDDRERTWWRVFYAYHTPDDGPASLDEVFSTYRNHDVSTRVRFDPGRKVAEVQFLQGDVVTKTERYELGPAAPPDAAEPAPAEQDCFVHVEELPPLLPDGSRKLEPQHVVEEQQLAKGARVVVRHGGCVHYTQVWTVTLAKIPRAPEGRLRAAKTALMPFEGAGPILEALERALLERDFDEHGGFPCGEATCAVETGALEGAPALIVSYDVPL